MTFHEVVKWLLMQSRQEERVTLSELLERVVVPPSEPLTSEEARFAKKIDSIDYSKPPASGRFGEGENDEPLRPAYGEVHEAKFKGTTNAIAKVLKPFQPTFREPWTKRLWKRLERASVPLSVMTLAKLTFPKGFGGLSDLTMNNVGIRLSKWARKKGSPVVRKRVGKSFVYSMRRTS